MKQSENMGDTEIITRVLQGEKSLYELVVRRYNADLYKVGRSYNFNHEDTQDLMQDTYVDAFKDLSQFEQRSNFKTWLIRIMLNNCYHKKQKFSVRNELAGQEINENVIPLFSNHANDTSKMIYRHELKYMIEDSLSKIPEDYRMIFSLREVNGLNILETARLLGISESNVKVRLNRAKAMLREQMQQHYNPGELYEFNLIYCDVMVERVMKEIYKV